MANKSLPGYVDIFGKHGVWIGDHTGPASYATWTAPNIGGEVITAQSFGLRSIDHVIAEGADTTGTYYTRQYLTGTGLRTTAILIWYVLATGVQVANGTNLSAVNLRMIVHGG